MLWSSGRSFVLGSESPGFGDYCDIINSLCYGIVVDPWCWDQKVLGLGDYYDIINSLCYGLVVDP